MVRSERRSSRSHATWAARTSSSSGMGAPRAIARGRGCLCPVDVSRGLHGYAPVPAVSAALRLAVYLIDEINHGEAAIPAALRPFPISADLIGALGAVLPPLLALGALPGQHPPPHRGAI